MWVFRYSPVLLAILVLRPAGIAEEPVRVHRRFNLNHQALASLELDRTRTALVAVNTHADVGVIADVSQASKFRQIKVAEACAAAFSSDSKLLFVASTDGRVTVLDRTTLKPVHVAETEARHGVVLRTYGSLLAVIDVERTVHLFQTSSDNTIRPILVVKKVAAISGSPEASPSLRFLNSTGVLHTYQPDSLELTSRFLGPPKPVGMVIPDVIGADDYVYARAGERFTRTPLQVAESDSETFDLPFKSVNSFDFVGGDGLVVASGTKVAYVDRRARKALATGEVEEDVVTIVKALSTKDTFVAALNDGTVVVFSLPTQK